MYRGESFTSCPSIRGARQGPAPWAEIDISLFEALDKCIYLVPFLLFNTLGVLLAGDKDVNTFLEHEDDIKL